MCSKDSIDEVNYLCTEFDGIEEEMQFVGMNYDRVIYKYKFPLSSIVGDFYTKLKSVTHGHGSFDYEECGWDTINLVQVLMLINKKPIGPLSVLCDKSKAYDIGKELCQRLGKAISRQLYEVNIQAMADGKIISKYRLPPFRKDVLIKAYVFKCIRFVTSPCDDTISLRISTLSLFDNEEQNQYTHTLKLIALHLLYCLI